MTIKVEATGKLEGRTLAIVEGSLDFDTSYPTGGESISDIFNNFVKLSVLLIAPQSGYVFETDYTNKKVKVMYANYPAAAAGALIEVPNGTNLSALTSVKYVAVGIV